MQESSKFVDFGLWI